MSEEPLTEADPILSPPTVDEIRTKACNVSYGKRLEVKQSAARQTWAAPKRPRPPRYGIPERTGYYEDGVKWTALPQRGAGLRIAIEKARTEL
jgi:hypothetical protein